MNQYSNDQGACLTDALLNYETVSITSEALLRVHPSVKSIIEVIGCLNLIHMT